MVNGFISIPILLTFSALLLLATDLRAQNNVTCAGFGTPVTGSPKSPIRKMATEGDIKVLVVFGKFKDEYPGRDEPPEWASSLFDPDLPGSVTHFFKTMSRGKLNVTAEIAPGYYEASGYSSDYVAEKSTVRGDYAQFSHEILKLADEDIDFAQLTNNGPDGIPNSRDDNRYAEATFVILDRVPKNFLVGNATGIASWGLYSDFVSKDLGTRKFEIRVSSNRVFVIQGGSFNEASGVFSHEFGHLLGLPDLFNLDYAIFGGDTPKMDSAGIGAWGVMGWGALGWNGNDGPNSFTGWSLRELGWLDPIRPTSHVEDITLDPVMVKGEVYEVLLPNGERFLIENRQREGTYYDRNIPGEGLLIWHEDPSASGEQRLDLECADGKWMSAGYPQGSSPDPMEGEDNLDYWAHDKKYSDAHMGNLGDATDPFDGVRFKAFTPKTNPDARSRDLNWGISIDQIHIDGKEVATARIRTEALVLSDVRLVDEDGDGVIIGDERAALGFDLAISSELSQQLFVTLTSEDSLIRIENSDLRQASIRRNGDEHLVGGIMFQPTSSYSVALPVKDSGYDRYYNGVTGRQVNGLPTLSWDDEFEGVHQLPVSLDVYWLDGGEKWELAWVEKFTVSIPIVTRPQITDLTIADDDGNGRAKVGEVIQLSLELHSVPELLQGLKGRIRSLNPGVVALGSGRLDLDGNDDPSFRLTRSPEFMLTSDVTYLERLQFEVTLENERTIWTDTLSVVLEEGTDTTPPRVLPVLSSSVADGLSLVMPFDRVIDGSELAVAKVGILDPADTSTVMQLPMKRYDNRYEVLWKGAKPGSYLLRGIVEDVEGNVGESDLQLLPIDYPKRSPLSGGVIEFEFGAPVTAVEYGSGGQEVAVVHGNQLSLINAQTLLTQNIIRIDSEITAFDWSDDGQVIAVADQSGGIRIFVSPKFEEQAFIQHDSAITEISLGPDGRLLATGSDSGRVFVWNIDSQLQLPELEWAEAHEILSLAFSPGGETLVVGRGDGSLGVWQINSPPVVRVIKAHEGGVETVAFNNEGSWMVSGSRDHTVKLWSFVEDQLLGLKTFREHEDWVSSAGFGWGGQGFVTGSVDGTIVIRDVERWSTEPVTFRHVGGLSSIALDHSGNQLVSGTWNGTLQFWQLGNLDGARSNPLPREVVLLPAYPNPFNSQVNIPFRLFVRSNVSIKIYDVAGQLVRILDIGDRWPGLYHGTTGTAYWDGRNQNGQDVGSGVYLGVVSAGETKINQKMLLLR